MSQAPPQPDDRGGPHRRPTRAIPASRKDNRLLAMLMTAPHGRTITELIERLRGDGEMWATRDNVYASCLRLFERGLVVRQVTPEGHLYEAVAPDPDDPLEQLFASTPAPEVEVPEVNASDRQHKTRRDRYTHDEIIAAILRWADNHDGEPPCQTDWNPAMLRRYARRMAVRAVGHLARIAEYDSGDWPSEHTVRKYFGSWNAALAAAGFHHKLRSRGNQPRESDLTFVPGVGAAGEMERLLDTIIRAHHDNDQLDLRGALFDLSIAAREWAMRIEARQ